MREPSPYVSVPRDLLEQALALHRCDENGAWCWEHEDQPWPCPMERLRRRLRPVIKGSS